MSLPEIPPNIQFKLARLLPNHTEELERFLDLLIVRWEASPGKRGAHGVLKGRLGMKDNFDDPVPGMEKYLP